MDKLIEDRYLGDGVYASYDDNEIENGIMLDLRAQEPTLPITQIWLNAQVYAALLQYVEDIRAAKAQREANLS
jgi:hypothetical protein